MSNETIDTNLTVNDMVATHPETIAVFNRFGLDTCCGGGVSIAEAARRDGAKLGDLVQALHGALDSAGVA